MKTLRVPSTTQERDEIAVAIEDLLRSMESEGKGTFDCVETSVGCYVSFGILFANGGTIDIALVRIASAMMDHPKYEGLLKQALRGPMKESGLTPGS